MLKIKMIILYSLLPVDATVDGEDSAWAERVESGCGDDDEYGGVK